MKRSVRSTSRMVLLLTLLWGGPLIPSPTLGQAAGGERQERLQERDRLWAEARRLRAQGQLDEAITAAEKMLAIEREALGAEHPEVAASLGVAGRGVHRARGLRGGTQGPPGGISPPGEAAWG